MSLRPTDAREDIKTVVSAVTSSMLGSQSPKNPSSSKPEPQRLSPNGLALSMLQASVKSPPYCEMKGQSSKKESTGQSVSDSGYVSPHALEHRFCHKESSVASAWKRLFIRDKHATSTGESSAVMCPSKCSGISSRPIRLLMIGSRARARVFVASNFESKYYFLVDRKLCKLCDSAS